MRLTAPPVKAPCVNAQQTFKGAIIENQIEMLKGHCPGGEPSGGENFCNQHFNLHVLQIAIRYKYM